MNYNAYALDKLNTLERVQFSNYLPPGIHFKIAGEEYENQNYNAGILNNFVSKCSGKVSIICGTNFSEFHEQYKKFDKVERVYYRNEIWHEITNWQYVKNDLFGYLFNKEKYYRRHATLYVREARELIKSYEAKGIEIEVVLNVPLPQNKYLRAFLESIWTIWNGPVSIHVYGKFNEADYFQKLTTWISEITSRFETVVCGEMNGLFNHKTGRELKNSNLHYDYHNRIIEILNAHGINEIYYFTLVANQKMMNWNNPPIYNRFLVNENGVTDTLTNVFR